MKQVQFDALQHKPTVHDVWTNMFRKSASWILGVFIGILMIVTAICIVVPVSLTGNLHPDSTLVLTMIFAGGVSLIYDCYRQTFIQLAVKRFARDNGFIFEMDIIDRNRPGTLFRDAYVRIAQSLRTPGFDFLEYGNFQYLTPRTGRSTYARSYGYLRLKVPRRLPNMILESRQNKRLDLPIVFGKDQVLSLEGNFNDYYTLYAPREYERDALYIFTPDIMERFMALAQHYTCEIVDDELYLYGDKPFQLTSVTETTEVFDFAAQLLQKFDRQIDYYADDRLGDRAANLVGNGGQRLRTSNLRSNIIFSVIMALVFYGLITLLHR